MPSAVDDTKIVVGDVGAPYMVTVYADARCPSCARFEAGGGAVLSERAFEGSGVGGTPAVKADGEVLDGGVGLYGAGRFGRLLDGALGS
nr:MULTISPECIES: thioredoxin domain-containing protein [unclassified Streptomyces]